MPGLVRLAPVLLLVLSARPAPASASAAARAASEAIARRVDTTRGGVRAARLGPLPCLRPQGAARFNLIGSIQPVREDST